MSAYTAPSGRENDAETDASRTGTSSAPALDVGGASLGDDGHATAPPLDEAPPPLDDDDDGTTSTTEGGAVRAGVVDGK